MSASPPRLTRRQLIAGLAALFAAGPAWAATSPEQLKAVFLLRFLRYVQFGTASEVGLLPDGEELCIEVVGAPDVAAALVTVTERMTDGGATIRTRDWTEEPDGTARCQVLFVRGEPPQVEHLVASLTQDTLVVGDERELTDVGAALAFFWEEDRLRFVASQTNATRRGVRLSAELLRLARQKR